MKQSNKKENIVLYLFIGGTILTSLVYAAKSPDSKTPDGKIIDPAKPADPAQAAPPKIFNRNMTAGPDFNYLIHTFEGFQAKPYKDGSGMSIGYGHQILSTEKFTEITEDDAFDLLQMDKSKVEKAVQGVFQHKELNQHQFDALCSFAYNVGIHNLLPAQNTFVRRILANDTEARIREAWAWWNKANGQVSDGLKKRREAEMKAYFFKY